MDYENNKVIEGNFASAKYKKVSLTLQENTYETILNETYKDGIKIPLSQLINKKLRDSAKNKDLIQYLKQEILKKEEIIQQQTQLIQTLNNEETKNNKKKNYFVRVINAILNMD